MQGNEASAAGRVAVAKPPFGLLYICLVGIGLTEIFAVERCRKPDGSARQSQSAAEAAGLTRTVSERIEFYDETYPSLEHSLLCLRFQFRDQLWWITTHPRLPQSHELGLPTSLHAISTPIGSQPKQTMTVHHSRVRG